jgi:hypothetical protein
MHIPAFTSHLSPLPGPELAPLLDQAFCLMRARLPGFVGPIPPPLLMREQLFSCRHYPIVAARVSSTNSYGTLLVSYRSSI